jgi:hypothetical protein
MSHPSLPADVTRFILTSIPSVPHLEAILLLRQDPLKDWDAKEAGSRLYIPEKRAEELLQELTQAGMFRSDGDPQTYRFLPASAELGELIEKLAEVYAKQIVVVTNLIHSKSSSQVQQFADAFKLRKD